MSPLDEIKYINKLAAKKGGKKNLGGYQRWVLGGCRGPNPALGRRAPKAGKPCPKTKPSVELYLLLESIEQQVGVARGAFGAIEATLKRVRKLVRRKTKP